MPRDGARLAGTKPARTVGDDQLRTLSLVHERFAGRLSASLSTALRLPVEVKHTRLDQTSYGEYLRGVENPGCLAVVRAAPLPGDWALDLHLAILIPIIDRLLGGGCEPAPLVRRSLSPIEQRLALRVAHMLLVELSEAWRGTADLDFSVERVQTDPRAARIMSPAESVVRVRFELAMHAARGLATLCLPAAALRPLAVELSATESVADQRLASPAGDASHVTRDQATVQLVARLAPTRVAAEDIAKLQTGDIIRTDQPVEQPLSVCLDGAPRFSARPGVLEGHKAVRLENQPPAPSDVDRE